MLPIIELEVFKEDKVIETIKLEGKTQFILGSNREKSNVVLMHASISRCHAALIVDQVKGVMIVDLLSKAGTWVNSVKQQSLVAEPIRIKDTIKFG